jgi:hypothetical protein
VEEKDVDPAYLFLPVVNVGSDNENTRASPKSKVSSDRRAQPAGVLARAL